MCFWKDRVFGVTWKKIKQLCCDNDSHKPLFILYCQLAEDVKGIKTAEEVDELRTAKGVDSRPADNVEGLKPVKNDVDLNISKDFEDLKSKLNMMDSKLREVSYSHWRFKFIEANLDLCFICFLVHVFWGRNSGVIIHFIRTLGNYLRFNKLHFEGKLYWGKI
jgi:hypothetical protein